jgi:hypothetical protein
MALAYSIEKRLAMGNVRGRLVKITTDTDYAAGGYAISAASCGLLSTVDALVYAGQPTPTGYLPVFDTDTQKLAFYRDTGSAAAFTEASSGDNGLADVVWVFLALEVFNG